MSLAETAVLAVELKLNGATQFKSGIAEADAAAASLGKTTTVTGSVFQDFGGKMGFVKQAVVSTGQAISGMASHFKNVITGPLGLIGLGAGLFTVAGAIHSGIEEAQTFGLEVQKLQGLTGQSVDSVSALAAALDHFGVSGDAAVKTVGMLTKNIGNIVNSKAGLAGFATTFNLSLTDAKGHLVSINEEILRTADYFNNKSIPATEKAAALAKLYGRSWQQLIPFLQAGRKGITEAEQAAKDLGLTLTAQNLTDLKQYRENFLTLGDATKGLSLQVGLTLIPLLSDLAKSITSFLRNGGRDQIVSFFKGMADNARTLGNVISTQVIPTLQGLASTAKSFWDSIPAPLRDLIFKGVVADRTIHFLFGVSPLHLAGSLIGDVAGPIIKTLIANRLIPQPVVIVGGGGGLPGGLPNVVGSGGGLLAAAGGVAGIAAIAAVVVPLAAIAIYAGLQPNPHPGQDKPGNYSQKGDYRGVFTANPATNLLDRRAEIPLSASMRHFDVTNAKTAASNMEAHRGDIGDAIALAEQPANALVKMLPGHIAMLQRELVGATGKNAIRISTEIRTEKTSLKAAVDAVKRAVDASATKIAGAMPNSLTTGIERLGSPSVYVNVSSPVSATSVVHRTAVVHRAGPSSGTRLTSGRQNEGIS